MGGAFVGRFTGIIPSIMISGLFLYLADKTIFDVENIDRIIETLNTYLKNQS